MEANYLANVVAALSTLVVGAIYYNPKVLGTVWMKANNLTEEQVNASNPLKTYGLTIVFSLILAFLIVPSLVVHQLGAMALVDWNNSDPALVEFFKVHGTKHLNYGHGALHGAITGILFIFPLTAINGLFGQRSWKAIFIDAGYWTICLALMGAIICGWQK